MNTLQETRAEASLAKPFQHDRCPWPETCNSSVSKRANDWLKFLYKQAIKPLFDNLSSLYVEEDKDRANS